MAWLTMTAIMALLGADADKASATKIDPAIAKQAAESMRRGVEFLRKAQDEDGSFATGDAGPAITGLAMTAILRSGRVSIDDPMVVKGLAYLEKNVRDDGGIYGKEGGQRNYSTAVSILAFVEANKDGKYKDVIAKAVEYLRKEQWDEGEGLTPEDAKYGGAGYGGPKKTRPDLSNTTFLLEALQASGVPSDDPAFQRAVVFVRRCQNLAEEGANDLPFAKQVNDGGFYYTPVENYNPGGIMPEGGLRSYGSMTYAGLKSFIYAGVKKDDPRVKAALSWIRKHYTLEENPGMGQQGLYYYYHTFAKALAVLDLPAIEGADGSKHDWRADLVKTLVAKQKPDGSWTNDNTRWLEGEPRLVTAYSVLAMAHATE